LFPPEQQRERLSGLSSRAWNTVVGQAGAFVEQAPDGAGEQGDGLLV
jgi:hypothetical protein